MYGGDILTQLPDRVRDKNTECILTAKKKTKQKTHGGKSAAETVNFHSVKANLKKHS